MDDVVAQVEALLARRDRLRVELSEIDTQIARVSRVVEARIDVPRARAAGRRGIRPDSTVGRAVAVLRVVGGPMHVDRMLSVLNADGQRPVQKATLVSNLSRYVNMGWVFTRPGSNVFGLLDWHEGAQADDAVARGVDYEHGPSTRV